MDPLRFAIACVPLAAYLLLLGVVNLRRRPLLTSGAADLITLGLALTGLVFIGPIELFCPARLTADLGKFAWLVMLMTYWASLATVVLVLRPRLVVYNVSLEQLRPAVADAARQLDPEARWAGNSLSLPRIGVHLHLDGFGVMRNTSLVACGSEQNLGGWLIFRRAMQRSLANLQVQPNPRSMSFFLLGSMMFTVATAAMLLWPLDVAKAWSDIFAF